MSLQPWNAIQSGGPEYVLTDAATISGMDCSISDLFKVTLGGNRTLAVPTNMRVGQTVRLKVVQDGTGSRTLANGTGISAPSGTWTLTATAAAIDYLTFWTDGTTVFGMVTGLDFGA